MKAILTPPASAMFSPKVFLPSIYEIDAIEMSTQLRANNKGKLQCDKIYSQDLKSMHLEPPTSMFECQKMAN